MADIVATPANVRPLTGAIVRRGALGLAATPGMSVYLDGANGWKPTDADALASAQGRGVVVSDNVGSLAFVAGQTVDIVVHGPVTGYAGMTPGGVAYCSVNPGLMDQVKPALQGDFPFVMGFAESASTLFVNPQSVLPVVNP